MTRCVLFLIRVHHKQIIATNSCRPLLRKLKEIIPKRLSDYKRRVGFNLQGLRYMQQLLKEKSTRTVLESKKDRIEIQDKQLINTMPLPKKARIA